MFSFDVSNIGIVKSARIESAPLTLFVGKNNTGKSYVATVFWALSNLSKLVSRDDARHRRPAWFTELLQTAISGKGATQEINQELGAELITYLNEELRLNASPFLREVFAFDGFDATKIKIEAAAPFSTFHVGVAKFESQDQGKGRGTAFGTISGPDGKRSLRMRFPLKPSELSKQFADRFFSQILYRAMFGEQWLKYRSALYIPAARTGLIIALRALISQSFESDERPSVTLPLPLQQFLQRLTLSIDLPADTKSEIANWLENDVLDGTIKASYEHIPTFDYLPARATLPVPLHAASSMVTELAPFLILLKQPFSGQIVFEEPEAHLHLSAQRSMARALARLLNTGTKILATTHSDTFIQQINNLMQLHNHPNRDDVLTALGYTIDDLINPNDVKIYEFCSDKIGNTEVRKANREDGGFVVPSLNSTLFELAQETIELQRDDK